MGFAVAAMDCRGQGGLSEDNLQVKGTTRCGHIIRGLQDEPDRLYFRNVFLDTAELARIVMNMPEIDENRVGAAGASQGGALSIACAALEPRIHRIAPCYPFLSDYLRVWEMDLAKDAYGELVEFFRRHDPLHAQRTLWFTRLGYIDVQYLAPRIEADVMMAVGLMDEICPPSTQFAAYNKITAPKQLVTYPDFGHEPLPGWWDRVVQFMQGMAVEG
jgi:cephalosporin-C deacetylase